MADWRDVMNARSEADAAQRDADAYAGALEDADRTDNGLGLMLAARAICLELRALGTTLDYSAAGICNTVGRP